MLNSTTAHKSRYFALLTVICASLCYYVYVNHGSVLYHAIHTADVCQSQSYVTFVKVHKTGSSTVANVIFRYGVRHNSTFLLPKYGVHVSKILNEPWRNTLRPPSNCTYEILTSHSVHNPTEWHRLLPPDSMRVAILREPLSHLQSAIFYFRRRSIPGKDKLRTFLANPRRYRLKEPTRPWTVGMMSYEMGIPVSQMVNTTYIKEHALRLDKTYKLVIITELMDQSLVLLRRYMCWQTRDIIYIKRNVNKKKPKSVNITEKLRLQHKKIAEADYYIYNVFYKKLLQQIEIEGPRYTAEVTSFKQILAKVKSFCDNEYNVEFMTIDGTEWSEKFTLTKLNCKQMKYNGIQVLSWALKYQYGYKRRRD